MANHFIGRYYGKDIHAREVTAYDEAGDKQCWIRTNRHGDRWLLIRTSPRVVSRRVRRARQIPPGAESERFPPL